MLQRAEALLILAISSNVVPCWSQERVVAKKNHGWDLRPRSDLKGLPGLCLPLSKTLFSPFYREES